MVKRDWKLPNPSYFTYTSIVQQILQANNLFLQFLVVLISSRFEAGKTATKWYKMARSPPQWFNGVSQWWKSSYTLFYSTIPHFYKQSGHFTQFLGQLFTFKCSKFEARKWAGKIASKWYKNGSISPTGYLRAPQCFNGVSQWLKAPYTPFYTVFGSAFTFKCNKFKARK